MPNLETLFIENFNKGKALFEQGAFDKAVVYLERAYRIKPDDGRLLNMLGMTYFRLNQLDEAVQIYEVLARKNPNIPVLFSNLGLIKMKLGDLDGAEMAFLRVIELQPDNRKVYGYLGLIAERRGEIELALDYYEKAGAKKKIEVLKSRSVEVQREVAVHEGMKEAGTETEYDEADVIEVRPLHEHVSVEQDEETDEAEYTRPMEDIIASGEFSEDREEFSEAPPVLEEGPGTGIPGASFTREDLKDTREYEELDVHKLLRSTLPREEGEQQGPRSPFDSPEVEATIEEESPMTIFMPATDTAVTPPDESEAEEETEDEFMFEKEGPAESGDEVEGAGEWSEGYDTSPGGSEETMEEEEGQEQEFEREGNVFDWTYYRSGDIAEEPSAPLETVTDEEGPPSIYIAAEEDVTEPSLDSGPPPYESPIKETVEMSGEEQELKPERPEPEETIEAEPEPEDIQGSVMIVKPPEPEEKTVSEDNVRPVNLGLYAREQLYIHPPAGSERFLLLEPYLLEVVLSDRVLFREGSMVAFNGHLIFERYDVTQDYSLIHARGLGILFLSYSRYAIHLISLNEEKIFVSLPNFLVAQASLSLTPRLITQTNNRMFPYLEISGTGTVGFVLRSKPLDIKVMRNLPAVVNSDAIVAWSGSVHVESVEDPQVKSLVRAYSEQALPLRFQGVGDVIVEQGALWGDRRLMTKGGQD